MTNSYHAFTARYCNNQSYPAKSDWIHLCEDVEGNCDRVEFFEGTNKMKHFWGKVDICYTDDDSIDISSCVRWWWWWWCGNKHT